MSLLRLLKLSLWSDQLRVNLNLAENDNLTSSISSILSISIDILITDGMILKQKYYFLESRPPKNIYFISLVHSADTGNLLAMFHSLLSESNRQDGHGEGDDSLDQGGAVLGVTRSSTETVSCRHHSQSLSISLYIVLVSPCR